MILNNNFVKKCFRYLNSYRDHHIKKYKSADVIIISNLLSQSQTEDLYFGKIDKILLKKKIKVQKFFRNFTYKNSNKISKNLKNYHGFLIPKRFYYINEIKYLIIFLPLYLYFVINFNRKIKKLSLFSTISHLRLYEQIKDILKNTGAKNLLITFEGHLWEKLIIRRCIKNRINVIGYQFTKLNEKSKIFRDKKILPNYIATSGIIDFKILRRFFPKKKLFILGSEKFKQKYKIRKKKIDFLILPNASLDSFNEVERIINYLKINYKCLVRLHPINSKNINYFRKHKKILSKNKLDKDIENSKYIIFEESSLSLNCYNSKTIPLYFKYLGNDDNNLPWGFPKELILNDINNIKRIYNKKLSNKTLNYLKSNSKDYFQKVNIKELIKVLSI